jgi:hypothetical protein
LLERQTARSLRAAPDDIAYVADLLGALGWDTEHPRATHEAARMVDYSRGALVVLYHSGSVLVQGKDSDATMTLLEGLRRADEPQGD